MASLTQVQPHLARSVTPVVLVIGFHNQLLDLFVAQRPRRRFPTVRLIISRRGEFAPQLGQLDTNRLDPEPVVILVDELDN
jgi:hypothetical protein